jgi:hypothetical protein
MLLCAVVPMPLAEPARAPYSCLVKSLVSQGRAQERVPERVPGRAPELAPELVPALALALVSARAFGPQAKLQLDSWWELAAQPPLLLWHPVLAYPAGQPLGPVVPSIDPSVSDSSSDDAMLSGRTRKESRVEWHSFRMVW